MNARCWSLLSLALLSVLVACDGGELIVFSPNRPGSAGNDPSLSGAPSMAGTAGSVTLAGNGGSGPSGSGGIAGDPFDRTCQRAEDCDLSWLCQKQSCSDALGVCTPIPVFDDSRFMPVCGCDRITYWNDTLRQVARVAASTPGSCQADALPCTNRDDCGPFGACRQILPNINACGMPPGTGQCWAIPNDCTSADDRPVYLPCPPPAGSSAPPPACLSLCQVLQTDGPYLHAPRNWDCGGKSP